MEYSLAVAAECGTVHLALGDGASCLLKSSRDFSTRESSSIMEWILAMLAEKSIELGDVRRWTLGTGPGGFTALRILSSTVSSLTFMREGVQCRGVPSACAMASKILKDASDGSAAVLFPAQKNSIFYQMVSKQSGKIIPGESGTSSALESLPSSASAGTFLTALEKNREMISGIPGTSNLQPCFLTGYPAEELLWLEGPAWDRKTLRDLIYSRPAVDSEAK